MHTSVLYLLAACGWYHVGMGFDFAALRPTMPAEDERFVGLPLDTLADGSYDAVVA